jgi:hypothetical protein
MTNARDEKRSGGRRQITLRLERQEAGTLLGSLAWVMGALQIMRDRGHAAEEEEFHELHDTLVPRLETLVSQLAQAGGAQGGEPGLDPEVERAYGDIREAFETWIHLTAVDTFTAAVGTRLDDVELPQDEAGAAGEDDRAGP